MHRIMILMGRRMKESCICCWIRCGRGEVDLAKLAVMPKNADDVLRLLKVTYDIKKQYPALLVVTMSMGKLGVISRLSGEIFGSCITFGADGEVSAPGQMQMETLSGILDALHASIGD